MATPRVRPAQPDDVGTILGFIRELAAYEREPDAVEATPDMLRRHLFGEGYGRGPTCEALIGEIEGEPHGFALYFMNFSTWKGRVGLYLEDLYVREASRGRGLGMALFRELARVAVARDCGRIEWNVLDWNEPALRFYRAIGAVAMSEWTIHRLAGDAIARLAGGR